MSWVLKHAIPVNQFSVYHIHGRNIWLANDDFSIRHWSLKTQSVVTIHSGHEGKVTGIDYCEDLSVLVTVSTDGRMILWNGKKIVAYYLNKQRRTDQFGSPLFSVKYCRQKNTIFVGSRGEILVFKLTFDFVTKAQEKNQSSTVGEISTIAPTTRLKLHSDIINKLIIVGDKLVSVSMDHTIGFTKLESLGVNKLIHLKLRQAITAIKYDPHSQFLLVGSIDGKIYSITRDGLILENQSVFTGIAVASIEVDARAKLVWAVSAKGDLRLLDEANLALDLTDYFDTLKERPIVGISQYVYFGVHYDESSQVMSVFLNNHYILGFMYDPSAPRVSLRMDTAIHALAFINYIQPLEDVSFGQSKKIAYDTLKDGTYIITGGLKQFQIWHQETRFKFMKIKEISSPSKITAITTSSHFIAFGDDKGNVTTLKTTTMEVARGAGSVGSAITSIHIIGVFVIVTTVEGSWHMLTLSEFPEPSEEKKTRMMAHNGSINASAYDPETATLITAGSDGLIKGWAVGGNLKVLANTPSVFLTGSSAAIATETGVCDMRKFGEIVALCLTLQHQRLITAHSDRQVRVWTYSIIDPELLITIPCGGCSITSLALDGATILAGLDDKTIRAFDLGRGRLVRSLVGHSDTVCAIATNPDAPYIASSSWDGALKLWTREEEKAPPSPAPRHTSRSELSARREKIARPVTTQARIRNPVPIIPQVSIYEKRKQEIERRKRREKAEEEAAQRTQIAKDLRALSRLIWENT